MLLLGDALLLDGAPVRVSGVLPPGFAFPGSETADGHAIGTSFDYNVRDWRISAGFHDLSDNFRTETGFVRRTGITKFRASVSPKFYPHAKVIRRIGHLASFPERVLESALGKWGSALS